MTARSRRGKSIGGKRKILGTSYITLYEPILIGADVVGILYVGVPKATASRGGEAEQAMLANEMMQIQAALATLGEAMAAKDRAEQEGLEQRYIAADAGRRAEAMTQSFAADQQRVVGALSQALESLAAMNLTHRIEIEFPEAYRNLKTNFVAAVTILRDTMRTIGVKRARSTAFPEKSPRPPRICPAEPSSRRRRWKKPRPPSTKSPRPSSARPRGRIARVKPWPPCRRTPKVPARSCVGR